MPLLLSVVPMFLFGLLLFIPTGITYSDPVSTNRATAETKISLDVLQVVRGQLDYNQLDPIIADIVSSYVKPALPLATYNTQQPTIKVPVYIHMYQNYTGAPRDIGLDYISDGGLQDGYNPVYAHLTEAELLMVSESSYVRAITLPTLLVPDAHVTSPEVGYIGADRFHDLNITGSGVTVAIIDSDFTLNHDIFHNALAENRITYCKLENVVDDRGFFIGEDCSETTLSSRLSTNNIGHGDHVAAIVLSMAPNVTLNLYEGNFGVNYMTVADKIIEKNEATIVTASVSVAWVTNPNFGLHVDFPSSSSWLLSGYSASSTAMNRIVDDPPTRIVTKSAGNAGNHWRGVYTPTTVLPTGLDSSIYESVMNFRPHLSDPYQQACLPSIVARFVTWDAWDGSSDVDYDLFYYESATSPPTSESTRVQDGSEGFPPVEFTSGLGSECLVIAKRHGGTTNHVIDIFIFDGDINAPSANVGLRGGSLSLPADASRVMTVGSVERLENGIHIIDPRSSRGPAYDSMGNIVHKPEICGYANVHTLETLPFTGTSAATPYVAGAAALLAELYKDQPIIERIASINKTLIESAVRIPSDVSTDLQSAACGAGVLSLRGVDVPPPVMVSTDKTTYVSGDTIVVSGQIRDILPNVQIGLTVTAPNNNRVAFQQLAVGEDKTFTTEIATGGSLWREDGEYVIQVQYGSLRMAETSITFGRTASPIGSPPEVLSISSLPPSGNGTIALVVTPFLEITIVFTKPIATTDDGNPFTLSDIAIETSPTDDFTISLDNLHMLNSSAYVFHLSPSGINGNVTLTIPAGTFSDEQGNLNTKSETFAINFFPLLVAEAVFDGGANTSTKILNNGDRTNATKINFTTVSASPQDLTGIQIGDILLSPLLTDSIISITEDGIQSDFTLHKIQVAFDHDAVDGDQEVIFSFPFFFDPPHFFRLIFDAIPPTIQSSTAQNLDNTQSLQSGVSTVSGGSDIQVTATFSEPINKTTFDVRDITTAGAAANAVKITDLSHITNGDTIPNTRYRFTVTAENANGNLNLTIPTGQITDMTGNKNTKALSLFNITYDSVSPFVTLTTNDVTAGNSTSLNTVTFTATFDMTDGVSALTSDEVIISPLAARDDLVVTLDTPTTTAGAAATYTITIQHTGSTDLPVTISIAQNAITDLGGNGNTASSFFTFIFDMMPPTITSFTAEAPTITTGSTAVAIANNSRVSGNNNNPITFTVTFSEDITGFSNTNDVMLTGVAADSISVSTPIAADSGDGNAYTFILTPTNANGLLEVNIPHGAATDHAGHPNTPSKKFVLTLDSTRPTATLKSSDVSSGDSTNLETITFTITFSEAGITGLTANEIGISTNPIVSTPRVTIFDSSPTTIRDTTVYTITLTRVATTDHEIILTIPENIAVDPVGNGNIANTTSYAFMFDTSKPGVVITTQNSTVPSFLINPSGEASRTIVFDVTFTEPVSGFDSSNDITLTGSLLQLDTSTRLVLSEPVPNTDKTRYRFTIQFDETHEGSLNVQILGGVAQDAAGNSNTPATADPLSFIIDIPQSTTGEILALDLDLPDDHRIPASSNPISFQVMIFEAGFSPELSLDAIRLSGPANETVSITLVTNNEFQIMPTLDTRGELVITIPAGSINGDAPSESITFALEFIEPPSAITPVYQSSINGGGKTTPLLASQMILYDACSPTQDTTVRVLTFNLPRIDTIQTNLYTPDTIHHGVDVTAQVPVSTYLENTSPGYVYTIFDAKLPAGTTTFFVTVFDTNNARWTTSTLIDLKDLQSSSSNCADTVFPHELKDTNARFIKPIKPIR